MLENVSSRSVFFCIKYTHRNELVKIPNYNGIHTAGVITIQYYTALALQNSISVFPIPSYNGHRHTADTMRPI